MTVLWPDDEELFATARRELFVAVVPQTVVSQAFALALEEVRGETAVLQALQGGMTTVDAFATFGIM